MVSEDLIFCGCADGAIRVFGSSGLQYVSTLQRPHRLGVDLTQSAPHGYERSPAFSCWGTRLLPPPTKSRCFHAARLPTGPPATPTPWP